MMNQSRDFIDSNKLSAFVSFRIIVDVYVVFCLCILGISGNIISLVVLGRDPSVKKTTGFLLQMLALSDALYLTTCLFFQTLNAVFKYTQWIPQLVYFWPWLEVYIWPCASIAQTAAVWLVVVVTADRYIAICKPLHAPVYSTLSRVRKAVLVVWVASIVYNLPRFFERTVIYQFNEAHNMSLPVANKTALRQDPVYFAVYKTCLFFVLRFLLPLSCLAFVNTRLIQAIRDSNKMQKKTRETGPKNEKYTLTLVVVVIVFAICETPDLVLRLWIAMMDIDALGLPHDRLTLLYINVITNLFLTVNSCINFIIYCFLGKKFRNILFQLVCKESAERRSSIRAYQHYSQSTVRKSSGEEMTTLFHSV